MFLLYNIVLTLSAVFWLPWMWLRTRRRKEQPNWKERGGDYAIEPLPDAHRIWFHAVSVGEVVASLPILRELRDLLPGWEIALSVTTSSGHKTARERAAGLYDHLVYFPIDVARFQLAAMSRVRPKAVAIMETELWFNFLWAARACRARTLLVNGRIGDRSFGRSRWLRFFYRRLLAMLDRTLAQSERDAERLRALGAQGVEVMGNCKFDEALEGAAANPAELRAHYGIPKERRVVVVGSTRSELEESLVIEAIQAVGLHDLTVIHAPRHLERAPALASAVEQAFGQVALRSKGQTGDYLILDTYGELSGLYAIADVVVIGGGFDRLGGQNLIQPLACGKPVLHGPHMNNFADVTASALAAGASSVCSTAQELSASLKQLLDDPEEREKMGAAARELVKQNAGASRRYAEAIAAEATR
ncbi:MAG: 3-deoxy-D-manno-octulosonic acid transferase [Fimbriimonas ginsengisoli]|uniref:3-deoxy-D-manno-octulosonic acid transferase n=1 Tax=Fimbriimonas ginsengisoli TaxID=1005039 RepID=A0A931PVF7_FIMGI|nr:3-deoxy-D-manno-octulosonic acid transferase [Fimbriimonas ginsengisoli]